jgi:hypothetical protein
VILLALLAGCLAFLMILRMTNVMAVTGEAARTAQAAASAMRSDHLTDDQKEAHVRSAAVRLFRSFLGITAIGVAALAVPALIVWAGAAIGLFRLEDALNMAMGWPFLIGVTAALGGVWAAGRFLSRDNAASRDDGDAAPDDDGDAAPDDDGDAAPDVAADAAPDVPYGRVDRVLHRIAFATPEMQKGLADVETRVFRDRINPDHARRPVFVTSLPRAGTTVMLEMLAGLPEFGSATYRHMPFALTPLLWSNVTRGLQRSAKVSERAHGDGIKVGFDSPEAFEEMVWKAFWPSHYRSDHIATWGESESNPEFAEFFPNYMSKVVASNGEAASRYLSKNNANVARLAFLERCYPDARFVIPIRSPWAQTASMRRQHLRFQKLHSKDAFARAYMEGLGHYEFGDALKPIAFGAAAHDVENAGESEFWLQYWLDAYHAVLQTAGPHAILVDHDALCRQPARLLPALAAALDLEAPAALLAAGRRLKPAPDVGPPDAPAELIGHARALHAELAALSLRPALLNDE